MKKNLILLFVWLYAASSISQNIITDASVTFKIRNLGFNVDGLFSNSQITSDFSSEQPSEWQLQGTVDIASVDTGNEKRDNHLLQDDYFNEAKFPKMTLVATSFKPIEDNFYNVNVDLTIKDKTKSIRVPMRIEKTSNGEAFTCNFKINRLDFEVGESSFVMSNTVKILVEYNINYN